MSDNDDKFEPGAAKLGNFITYYSFNPPEERIKILPTDCWKSYFSDGKDKILCLDVGCNTGDLTQAVYSFLENKVEKRKLYILGIDIDPVLIERAVESNSSPSIEFKCSDASKIESDPGVESFLKSHGRDSFDVTFLFSVTMWLHLNRGDDGLKEFLRAVSRKAEMIVVEPQPWKCYRSAARRIKRLKQEAFPFWEKLKMRQSIEEDIENFLCRHCGFYKSFETERTSWGRKIVFFRRILS